MRLPRQQAFTALLLLSLLAAPAVGQQEEDLDLPCPEQLRNPLGEDIGQLAELVILRETELLELLHSPKYGEKAKVLVEVMRWMESHSGVYDPFARLLANFRILSQTNREEKQAWVKAAQTTVGTPLSIPASERLIELLAGQPGAAGSTSEDLTARFSEAAQICLKDPKALADFMISSEHAVVQGRFGRAPKKFARVEILKQMNLETSLSVVATTFAEFNAYCARGRGSIGAGRGKGIENDPAVRLKQLEEWGKREGMNDATLRYAGGIINFILRSPGDGLDGRRLRKRLLGELSEALNVMVDALEAEKPPTLVSNTTSTSTEWITHSEPVVRQIRRKKIKTRPAEPVAPRESAPLAPKPSVFDEPEPDQGPITPEEAEEYLLSLILTEDRAKPFRKMLGELDRKHREEMRAYRLYAAGVIASVEAGERLPPTVYRRITNVGGAGLWEIKSHASLHGVRMVLIRTQGRLRIMELLDGVKDGGTQKREFDRLAAEALDYRDSLQP